MSSIKLRWLFGSVDSRLFFEPNRTVDGPQHHRAWKGTSIFVVFPPLYCWSRVGLVRWETEMSTEKSRCQPAKLTTALTIGLGGMHFLTLFVPLNVSWHQHWAFIEFWLEMVKSNWLAGRIMRSFLSLIRFEGKKIVMNGGGGSQKKVARRGKKKNRQSNPPDKILPFFLNWREETDNWWSWAVPIIWINASHCWSQKDGLGVESLIGDIRCFKVVPDSRRFSWICSRRDGSLYRSVWISWEGIMLFRWTLVHLFIAIDWMDEDNSLVNKKLSWDNLDLTDIESSRFYLLTDRSRWAERGEGLIKLPKTYVKIAVQIRDGDENDANMGRTAAINSIRKTSWRQTWEKKTTPVLSFRVDFDHQMVLDKKREHSYSTLLILVQSA